MFSVWLHIIAFIFSPFCFFVFFLLWNPFYLTVGILSLLSLKYFSYFLKSLLYLLYSFLIHSFIVSILLPIPNYYVLFQLLYFSYLIFLLDRSYIMLLISSLIVFLTSQWTSLCWWSHPPKLTLGKLQNCWREKNMDRKLTQNRTSEKTKGSFLEQECEQGDPRGYMSTTWGRKG